jgi:hypothetical protein
MHIQRAKLMTWLILWFAANIAAFILGFLLVPRLGGPVASYLLPRVTFTEANLEEVIAWLAGYVLTGLAMGLLVGLLQWAAMRRLFPMPARWITLTIAGFLFSYSAILVYHSLLNTLLDKYSTSLAGSQPLKLEWEYANALLLIYPDLQMTLLAAVVVGVVLSLLLFIWLVLAQWLAMRECFFRASRWIFPALLGLTLGFTINSLFISYMVDTYGEAIRNAALLPVITGAISGVCFSLTTAFFFLQAAREGSLRLSDGYVLNERLGY